MSDYRKLQVWRNSHGLALNVHSAIKKIRGSDYAKLRSQMLGAAMSIPTNLVEGVGQKTRKEFCRFIRISLNSANELDYHLLLARDYDVMSRAEHEALENQTATVRKMLHGLLRSLGDSGGGGSKGSPGS
jgi:four helix bundle protein